MTKASTQTLCPLCGEYPCHIMDSRIAEQGWRIRRRQCKTCMYRWTTYEITADVFDHIKRFLTIMDDLSTELVAMKETAEAIQFPNRSHKMKRLPGVPIIDTRSLKDLFTRRDTVDD